MSFQQAMPTDGMNPPSQENAPAYPVQIEFTTRFWGGNRFISWCRVIFDTDGFAVEGKRFWSGAVRLAVAFPFFFLTPLGLIPVVLILYYCARTYDNDYVRYADIIEIQRKINCYYILGRNDKGKKYWYSMKTPYSILPFMQWIDEHYFPQDNPQ